ncbi:MAG: hypothetical protein EOO86_18005 [Pedobacter sp.]|nr:MAG: hypothetical protein EOO86_18005 [Pedobacter sp.]
MAPLTRSDKFTCPVLTAVALVAMGVLGVISVHAAFTTLAESLAGSLLVAKTCNVLFWAPNCAVLVNDKVGVPNADERVLNSYLLPGVPPQKTTLSA